MNGVQKIAKINNNKKQRQKQQQNIKQYKTKNKKAKQKQIYLQYMNGRSEYVRVNGQQIFLDLILQLLFFLIFLYELFPLRRVKWYSI